MTRPARSGEPRSPEARESRLKEVIGYTVTAVWAVSFLADILFKWYDPSPLIHTIMMAVVGSLFVSGFVQKPDKGEKGQIRFWWRR